MLLSDTRIRQELENGTIIISPFDQRQLGTNSYDCRLGPWHFQPARDLREVDFTSAQETLAFWGEPQRAAERIAVHPGTTILAHTIEIVGARNGYTTSMHARSSIGRSSLSVCKCAGVGDSGYISRWTMEISNHSHATIWLPVGLRICQIKFEYIGKTLKEYQGKYGQLKEWSPYDMLPRLHQDWDLKELQSFNRD